MTDILVDSNVILDIFTEDEQWFQWSASQLNELANRSTLVINPIIYAEISIGFAQVEELQIEIRMRREAPCRYATFLRQSLLGR
jgi:hypothetical protein